MTIKALVSDFPDDPAVKTPRFQCRGFRFDPLDLTGQAVQQKKKKKKKKCFLNKSLVWLT